MRVVSFLRFPGLNCAKAMRDMRSPPKTAWGLRLADRGELLAGGQLDERRHHARRAHVDGEAEFHGRGVAALHGDDAPPEGGDRGPRGIVAQGLGQAGEHAGADVGRIASDDGEQLFEVGGLVVLLARERHRDEALVHAGVDGHAAQRAGGIGGPQHLERQLLDGRRHLHGHGLARPALAGQAVALAHLVGPELDLVHDGRRGIGPATNFTRHDVQRPRPPHVAVMSTPAAWAAVRIETPGVRVSARRADGSCGSVRTVRRTATSLDSTPGACRPARRPGILRAWNRAPGP